MPIVEFRLPEFASDFMHLVCRERRREITMMAERHAAEFGATVSIEESCDAGDPLVLHFHFQDEGPFPHATQQSREMGVNAFMQERIQDFIRPRRELALNHMVIVRPLREFWRPDDFDQALWKQIALPAVLKYASRAMLGDMFWKIDDHATAEGAEFVGFRFAEFRFQNNGKIVEKFAYVMRNRRD